MLQLPTARTNAVQEESIVLNACSHYARLQSRQTRATICQTKRRDGEDVESRKRRHPSKTKKIVLVISNQGLKHAMEVNGGPSHKMALLLFQSPIQVFGELAQGRRERQGSA